MRLDMASNYSSEVIKDLENAFENENNCDVIIKVGEDPDIKELRANSFILRVRCSYFERAFSNNWKEKDDDGNYIFKKKNISAEVFQLILRYLYTGIIDYNQCSKDVIVQCLVAADELGLDKLIEHIQEYLIKNEEYLHKDPVTTLEIIYLHESFQSLKDYCLEIISEEPRILFSSQKFPLIEKPIITMVLQRDDLNMEEIDIWESLLRWLFVHYLKIDQDDSTWSSDDLASVKQTIQEYIPLIRFYDISREDFYLKVYPYKDLLPQDLLNDILRYHMVPNSTPTLNFKSSRSRKSKVDSVLINYNMIKLFAKWIDKKSDSNKHNIPYQYNLLLRGTRDGFDAAKFHQLCNNKGATLVVAKVINSTQLIGGYNPLNWSNSNQYLTTNDSFLFKLDSNNLNSAKIGRVSSSYTSNAIYDHVNYGPTFGGGHDLYAQGNTTWSANNNSYTNISIPNSFTTEEYEVFQVVKKS
ncbi:hypothetical protein C1645_153253 [Glomus cerebriforme]|uniref:BTB/POZ domain-containing protein n=1 Tax=Glomus cerebriforme TaxID=658196 RepID=A0A397TT68_9GLOM|nr:hypothetical protein C1645_153253 [Glomus cerebriforme]